MNLPTGENVVLHDSDDSIFERKTHYMYNRGFSIVGSQMPNLGQGSVARGLQTDARSASPIKFNPIGEKRLENKQQFVNATSSVKN